MRPAVFGRVAWLVVAISPLGAQARKGTFILPVFGENGNSPPSPRLPASWSFELQPAPAVQMPSSVDSNSPSYWLNGDLYVINSTGMSRISHGSDQFHQSGTAEVRMLLAENWPTWIEAARAEGDGTVLAWYHQEQHNICAGVDLAVPRIGAAVSVDSGNTFFDLGTILSSGDRADCTAENGYFAGGEGDFSVVVDRSQQFIYFLFSSYGGPEEQQGIAVARMAYGDRFNPSGNVWKYFAGAWSEPGINGRVTPIFPVNSGWHGPNTDALWGPSVHWNSYLQSYVMLLNHTCCDPWWPEDGVFLSINGDLSDPSGWTDPQQVVAGGEWYPQIIGIAPGETDHQAGRVARFYMYGQSDAVIVFRRSDVLPPKEVSDFQ